MDGVRRWIGASHTSSSRKVSDDVSGESKTSPRKKEQEDLDPTSTEYIVAHLLSPTVSEVEEAEYEWCVTSTFKSKENGLKKLDRYIEQPQALLTSSGSTVERKDLDLYLMGVRASMGEIPDSLLSEVPDKAYVSYVQNSTAAALANMTTSFESGASRESGAAQSSNSAGFSSYERWVSTGTQRKVTGDFLLGHH